MLTATICPLYSTKLMEVKLFFLQLFKKKKVNSLGKKEKIVNRIA
jgi:hypothetical protein